MLPGTPEALIALRGLDKQGFARHFGEAHEQEGSPGKLAWPVIHAHDHWHNIHTALRNYFMDPHKPNGAGDEIEIPTEHKGRGHSKLEAEKRIVFEKVLPKILITVKGNPDASFVRVKEATAVDSQKAGGLASKRNDKGIYNAPAGITSPLRQVTVAKFNDLKREQLFVRRVIEKALSHFWIRREDGSRERGMGAGLLNLIRQPQLFSPEMKSLNIPYDDPQRKDNFNLGGELARTVVQRLVSDISQSTYEKEVGLPEQTLIKLIEREEQISRTIPVESDIKEFGGIHSAAVEMLNTAHAKQASPGTDRLKKLNEGMARLAQRISSQYGITPLPPYFASLHGGNRMADFEGKQRGFLQLDKKWGLNHYEMGHPPAESEVRAIFERLQFDKPTTEKLLDLFDRRNFLK